MQDALIVNVAIYVEPATMQDALIVIVSRRGQKQTELMT